MGLYLFLIAAVVVAASPLYIPVIFAIYLAAKKNTPSWQQIAFFTFAESSALVVSASLISWLLRFDGL